MTVLQFASLDHEAQIFLSRVTHRAPEVFSSIENVVKENAQVIYEYEQSKLSCNTPNYTLVVYYSLEVQ